MPAHWNCSLLAASGGFTACAIELGPIPLPAAFRTAHRAAFLRALLGIVGRLDLKPEFYLQVSYLHHEEQWISLQQTGKNLGPRQGLGVDPHDPPHQFTDADLEALDPRKPYKSFIDTVLRLTKTDAASAVESLSPHWGLGGTMCLALSEPAEEANEKMSAAIDAQLADPSFHGFPFYVPLLHRNNFGALESDRKWRAAMEGVKFYYRETPAQEGLFLMAAGSIKDLLTEVGLLVKLPGGGGYQFALPE